ncbi:MAG: hypothetical protein J6U57_01395 [Bacteroidales bacterium]|nr:hypothetical protein [Bacteroidales bacterium]
MAHSSSWGTSSRCLFLYSLGDISVSDLKQRAKYQIFQEAPQTIHVLLEAYDMALPRMTSYARFIVTVLPK